MPHTTVIVIATSLGDVTFIIIIIIACAFAF
jgi:hypothetical protein